MIVINVLSVKGQGQGERSSTVRPVRSFRTAGADRKEGDQRPLQQPHPAHVTL
jgi:hypothetical protein